MPPSQNTKFRNLLCITIVSYDTSVEVLFKTVASAIKANQLLVATEPDAETTVVLVNNNR